MISHWLLILKRLSRRLWIRAALISVGSLLALAIAPLLHRLIPYDLSKDFGREAVLPVLTILASGMLAVTTFSLNVMVSAYRAAADASTPRVYRFLLEDTTTHSALATFVGGFVYALSAIMLFHAGLYSPEAAVVIFALTVWIAAYIVVTILRWIDHLSVLGSMDHTLRMIEGRSRTALRQRAERPSLGARCATSDDVIPDQAQPVLAQASGYLRFIDLPKLQALADTAKTHLHIQIIPGDYILKDTPLAVFTLAREGLCKEAAQCFEIDDLRSFDQDPRLGLTLLAETAQRALSPGINDPGTAVEVLGRLERLLWENLPIAPTQEHPPEFASITLPDISAATLLQSAISPIDRDAEGVPEVRLRIAEMIDRLSKHPNPDLAAAAQNWSRPLTN